MKQNAIKRLEAKTPQTRFLRMLEHEYHFAPRIAQAILDEAEACLQGHSAALAPGQVRALVAQHDAGSGRPLAEIKMAEVKWTVDAGRVDREVEHRHGRRALRKVRIQRLLGEALDQGGVATQEDLAQALQTSVRTIKRDFAELEQEGVYLPSRGNLHGIGRGQTHKARIISRWMQGETYDQIAFYTRHATSSIKRYVRSFLRVVQLDRQGWEEQEIALLLQIGVALVREYLVVYQENSGTLERRRLEEHLARVQQPTTTPQERKRGVR